MKPWEETYFSTRFKEGEVYEITNFGVAHNKEYEKVALHPAVLQFAKVTKFLKVDSRHSTIPRYKFQFTNFEELEDKMNDNTSLTGILLLN